MHTQTGGKKLEHLQFTPSTKNS
uniref:Uncharacterized protein n=1 Tax=Arundo donax TaxID=35708 RepID=A0A0A9FWF4_ARUDO